MERLKLVLFSLLLSVWVCDGYKILTVFPVPSKSHGILGHNMVKHLLDAGHEVTYITPYRDDFKPNPMLHIVDVYVNEDIVKVMSSFNITLILEGLIDFTDSHQSFDLVNIIAASALASPDVQKLMKDPSQQFDVIIAEYMFGHLYSTFSAVFQSPLIWFSTIEPHWMITDLIDGPLNPAVSCHFLHASVAPYSFQERVYQLFTLTRERMRQKFYFNKKEEEVYYKLVAPIIEAKGRPVPSLDELKYNASMVLGNSQVAIGDAVALPQNYKHIGGYHIDDEVKPLPENLKKIMDGAKNGVVYFSMGSILNSKDYPVDMLRGLLKTFGGLKQTVIWKFEGDLTDVPKNVHIVKWAPQQSLLAHPNLVLFVTHGGLLSLTEAIYFGVPLIAIPVFADQYLNAVRADQKGFGKHVPLAYSLHDDLKVALDEVLGNPKYAAKAQELSTAFHDSPMKPKEALNFWVQHVVRTRGAPHLRSIALRLPLYQRLYLDLLALVLLAIVGVTLVVNYIVCKVIGKKTGKVKTN